MAVPLLLDGLSVRSNDAFDDAITEWSDFGWYGRNLDALWDVLTGIVDPPIEIHWSNAQLSKDAMGASFDQIVSVMREAEAELGSEQFRLNIDL